MLYSVYVVIRAYGLFYVYVGDRKKHKQQEDLSGGDAKDASKMQLVRASTYIPVRPNFLHQPPDQKKK